MSGEEDRPTHRGVLGFLRDTWIWWLTPLLVALIVVVLLLLFSEGKATSPFIYDNY